MPRSDSKMPIMAFEEELLGRDQLEGSSAASSASNIISVPGSCLDALAHPVEEAAIREVVPGLVHGLSRRVIAVVLLAQHEHELRAHVLGDARRPADAEHPSDRAPGGVTLDVLGISIGVAP